MGRASFVRGLTTLSTRCGLVRFSRHSAIRSMTQSRVTATTSLPELAALADTTVRAILHTLNITGRQRHSPRVHKHRSRFGHTVSTKKTVTGVPEVTPVRAGLDLAADQPEHR